MEDGQHHADHGDSSTDDEWEHGTLEETGGSIRDGEPRPATTAPQTARKARTTASSHISCSSNNASSMMAPAGQVQSLARSKPVVFSPHHVAYLVKCFKQHKDTLVQERTAASDEAKRNAWIEITTAMNVKAKKAPGSEWNVAQVKSKWKALLSKARSDYYWAREAAKSREPFPDIGQYSEVIWEMYGSKIDASMVPTKAKADVAAKEEHPVETNADNSIPNGLKTPLPSFGRSSDGEKTPIARLVTSTPASKMNPRKKFLANSASRNKKRNIAASSRSVENINGVHPSRSASSFHTSSSGTIGKRKFSDSVDEPMPKQSGPASWHSNTDMDLLEDSSDGENVEEMERLELAGTDDPLSYMKDERLEQSKFSRTEDLEDVGELRRRFWKAQIARIELKNTKTESQLEMIDMEKERIKLDKKKIELEMFLIRQKIDSVCSKTQNMGK